MSRYNTQQQDGAISAIPTRYKGYHFRSRLEARWAVFFDTMGCQWQYEPNGYQLADGSLYLPDFLIHEGFSEAAYIEVKPPVESALKVGLANCRALLEVVGASISLISMVVGPPGEREVLSFVKGFNGAEYDFFTTTDRAFGRFTGDPRVIDAINAARSARFEHGQCGPT